MINAAIVGLGWLGQNLVRAVAHSHTIRFSVAHTRTQATAAVFCAEQGLRWIGDLEAILRDPAIQAVVFATPHSQHAQQVQRAAAAGKAVFVEKPFALTLRDADAMLAAADRAGIVLAVGFNRRFHPSMTALRQAVCSGALGTVISVLGEQTALHGLDLTADAWRAQPDESPAGAMTAIGVHLVDGMIDLLGRVREVRAVVTRRAAPVSDDTTSLLLGFESGALGQVFCSVAATPHYRFAAYGTEGFAEILGHPMDTYRLVPAIPGEHRRTAAPQVTETPGFNMLTAELEAFATAVASDTAFPTPLADIRHGVAVFEAVVRSSAHGGVERIG
jgi:predicted dehydrogenase